MNKHRYKWKVSIWILLLTMLTISCNTDKKNENIKENSTENCLTERQLKKLKPITIEPSTVSEKLRLNGKVIYDPNAVVNYVSLVSGVIINTFVSLGDKVEKGQVLAEIRSAELNKMATQVKQLKAQLKVAQRELESQESFYEDNIASEREIIQAQSEKENIEAELENLQSNLELYSPAKRESAFQIRAPQSGYLVDNNLVTGLQLAAEGESLFTISDMNQVWVNMNIYATHLNFVKEGMPIAIKVNSYPNQVFDGEISWISHVMDPEENVLKARVILDNKNLLLKPGLQVEGVVEGKNELEMPRLPERAVVYKNDRYYVVIIKDECKLTAREVEVYSQDEHTMYIRKGLDYGERIISKNTLLELEDIIAKE